MVEKRESERLPVTVEVRVKWQSPPEEPLTFKTHDLSNNGVFLSTDDGQELPPVGERVTVQLKDLLANGETPPLLTAEVIRQDSRGMGLRFLD
ncbi:PilZ domain-containing protein [Nitrosococcus watsonii]|uniref:Type IV pilus assembly PilZ n=1 Tax=Nitrosococcus watsoni (strain C-113) TaxID=105559 RepID=D8KA98_NITWC|nr:PilZ domain-containing protein [Nitrosococcus watsonii]ADJ27413.1 type IV pilus assembly PilZ [Nitrosococcus watsonii C-113]